MKLFTILLLLLTVKLSAQSTSRPITNTILVVKNPEGTGQLTQLIEFSQEKYINTIEADTNLVDISTCINGVIVPFKQDKQKFYIQMSVKYLFITYKGQNKKVYLLLE